MNTEILELLQKHNHHVQEWDKVVENLHPTIEQYYHGKPVYQFFDTLSDQSLEKNGKLISISTQPLSSFVPYHVHNYVELTVVLLGKCVIRTATESIHLEQDDVILVGTGTIHTVEPINNGTIVVNIALKEAAFSIQDLNYIRQSGNHNTVSAIMLSLLSANDSHGAYNLFRTNHEKYVVNTVYDLIAEYYRPDSFSNDIIKIEVLELFIRLIRIAANAPQVTSPQTQQSTSSADLLTLLLYIEKNYQTITLDKIAKDFGFNANYLSSFLKHKTGYTFIKLVHLQRINVAAEYLSYTNAAIEKISQKVGYENPSYFYKIFKKSIGCSPSEYREKHQFTK